MITEECGSCGYEVDVRDMATYMMGAGNDSQPECICKICASTFISNAVHYNYENKELYMAIGWIGNYIIDEIRKGRQE
jgi:hypothetical protein